MYSQSSEGTAGEIVSVSYMYIQVGKGEDLNEEFRIHHTVTGRILGKYILTELKSAYNRGTCIPGLLVAISSITKL